VGRCMAQCMAQRSPVVCAPYIYMIMYTCITVSAAMAALLAGVSCFQLTGEEKYLELPRNQIAAVTGGYDT
jgi:hypothetical protein